MRQSYQICAGKAPPWIATTNWGVITCEYPLCLIFNTRISTNYWRWSNGIHRQNKRCVQLCLITRIDGIYIRENASVQKSCINDNHYPAAIKILSTFIDNKLILVYLFGMSCGFHVRDFNILNQFVEITVMPFESTPLFFFVIHTNFFTLIFLIVFGYPYDIACMYICLRLWMNHLWWSTFRCRFLIVSWYESLTWWRAVFLLIYCLYSCFIYHPRFAYYFPLKSIYSQKGFYTKYFVLIFSIDVVSPISKYNRINIVMVTIRTWLLTVESCRY